MATELPLSRTIECADRLFALAEGIRLQIVQLLRRGPQNVGQLAEAIGHTVVNVSHHLKIMEQNGIVEGLKQGRFVNYRLHPGIYTSADCLDFGCCKFVMPS